MDDFDELDDDFTQYQEVFLIPYVEMLQAIPDELYPENHRSQLMIRVMLRRLEEKNYPGQYPKNWATLIEVIDC
jgi:hypothetical protein